MADFDAARAEWEAAFARVPDDALTYLKPGDDYSLGGLQVHVNWVLAHYRRVLEAMIAAGFGELGPQDPPGDLERALDGARRGLTRRERRPALEEMARHHAALRAAVDRLPSADWSRLAPVVYGAGQDPYPTSPDAVIGWLREHYREHVVQSADLIEDWRNAKAGG